MSFGTTLGLFLNPERLTRAFHTPAPFDDPSRPSPGLMSAIYLWGIIISASPALVAHEPVFLSRAIYHASNSGKPPYSHLAKYTVQAELLIVYYFFCMGFAAEGKEHCDAAFRLALSEDIHKVRGTDVPKLALSTDAIEVGERMNAVWMTFLTDTAISCLRKVPTACPDQNTEHGRIDMPWPLDMEQYDKASRKIGPSIQLKFTVQQGLTLPESFELGTLAKFVLNPVTSYAYEDVSFLGMECKAATLLRRATAFAFAWNASELYNIPCKF